MNRPAAWLVLCGALTGCVISLSGLAATPKPAYQMQRVAPCLLAGVPAYCVAFAEDALTGDSYALPDKDGNVRVTILATASTAPWDTHGLVTLLAPAFADNTACVPVPGVSPMNEPGATLFVQTDVDGNQTLYLTDAGKQIQRELLPGQVKGTEDIAYLFAPASADGDYDYYVEFVEDGAGPTELKFYRVEAFPHVADQACNAERPDFALRNGQAKSSKGKTAVHPYESNSGEGNEPGH